MKKNYLFAVLTFVCVIFASCTSKEEKAAIQYLKSTMKSPSSFKVINVSYTEMDARIEFDTLYHISKVQERNVYGMRNVDAVEIDSIKIMRIEYPAYTDYSIEYDAANSFGAIIRDTESVVVCKGEASDYGDMISKYYDKKNFDHFETYKKTFNTESLILTDNLQPGKWVDKMDISDDWMYTIPE